MTPQSDAKTSLPFFSYPLITSKFFVCLNKLQGEKFAHSDSYHGRVTFFLFSVIPSSQHIESTAANLPDTTKLFHTEGITF